MIVTIWIILGALLAKLGRGGIPEISNVATKPRTKTAEMELNKDARNTT